MTAIRPLGPELAEAAWTLEQESFGNVPAGREGFLTGLDQVHPHCLLDGGRLVAMAVDRPYEQWWGGRRVPMAGVSSVAVAAELRGQGIAGQLLAGLLPRLRERGAAVSVLYPAVPAPYRQAGWERAGTLSWTRLSTASLREVRVPVDVRLRRAADADGSAVQQCYERIATTTNGLLSRTGPLFAAPPAEPTTLAEIGGRVAGYLGWSRGPGLGAQARLTAHDLFADCAPATHALLAAIGSWSPAVPEASVRLLDGDAATLLLPTVSDRVEHAAPWMLRLVDAPAAVAARGYPAGMRVTVDLDVDDPMAAWNSGRCRLVVEGGRGRLEPRGHASSALVETRVDQRGLALLYGSAAGTAVLRRAGLLSAGDPTTDVALDQAFAGPRPQLLDYF